jgi:hypothetical protein
MNLEQLIGRYLRLKEELGIAYSAVPWNVRRIDRLAREIASTEHAIRALRSSTQAHQSSDLDTEIRHAA